MRIIIEGADMTGKTTLAKYIVDNYPNMSYIHVNSKDPNNVEFYNITLEKTNVVFDRHFIGETIYPTLFNRQGNVFDAEFELIQRKAERLGYKIVVLTATKEQFLERLVDRPNEPKQIVENWESINESFKNVAYKNNIKVINVTDYKTMEDLVREVLK